LQHDHTAEVHRGERSVDDGAVDDPVYVVEAVAKDCYPGGDWYAGDNEGVHYREQVGEGPLDWRVEQEPHRYERGRVSEPFELLALLPRRAAETDHQARRRGEDQCDVRPEKNGVDGVRDRPQGLDGKRIRDTPTVHDIARRERAQGGQHRQQGKSDPRDQVPTWRDRPAVGEVQRQEDEGQDGSHPTNSLDTNNMAPVSGSEPGSAMMP